MPIDDQTLAALLDRLDAPAEAPRGAALLRLDRALRVGPELAVMLDALAEVEALRALGEVQAELGWALPEFLAGPACRPSGSG